MTSFKQHFAINKIISILLMNASSFSILDTEELTTTYIREEGFPQYIETPSTPQLTASPNEPYLSVQRSPISPPTLLLCREGQQWLSQLECEIHRGGFLSVFFITACRALNGARNTQQMPMALRTTVWLCPHSTEKQTHSL